MTGFLTGMFVLFSAVCAVCGISGVASASILYVAAGAPAGGDGSSWATAHRFLQDALAAAGPGSGVTEIRVAQGVYKPDRSEAAPNGTGDREATFQLRDGVALLGGYAGPGAGNGDPDARDWEVYETILSGDLLGNDGPDFTNYEDNSYTVVMATNTGPGTVIEGFVIERGNADAPLLYNPNSAPLITGSAMFSHGGSPMVLHVLVRLNAGKSGAIQIDAGHATILHSVFEHNWMDLGAGIAVRSGSAEIGNCIFRWNNAESGGAVHLGKGGGACFTITDCQFIGNDALAGGAIVAASSCNSSMIARCEFLNNSAWAGGAITLSATDENASIRLIDSLAFENVATSFIGGGIIAGGNIEIINTVIAGNVATSMGAGATCAGPVTFINSTIANNYGIGVFHEGPAGSHHNSIIWGNTGGQIGGHPSTSVNFSNIQGGWSGPGANNIDADPLFVQPGAFNFRLSEESPCLDIGDNSAIPPDVTTDLDGNPRIINRIVDLGAYEGEYELLPPAALTSNLQPGHLALLKPTGGEWGDDTGVVFKNTSDQVAQYVLVTLHLENPHPDAGGFASLAPVIDLETSLPDGAFAAGVLPHFSADDLAGENWTGMRVAVLDEDAGRWSLAAGATLAGPQLPQPPMTPIITSGKFFEGIDFTIGAHGVFWNPAEQKGRAWATTDRTGTFTAGVSTCPADLTNSGSIGVADLLLLLAWWAHGLAADLNNDGTVDAADILMLLSSWGTCPG